MKRARRTTNRKPNTKYELARAYVVFQRYGKTYSCMEALKKGVLWPALYRPYVTKY